MAMREKPSRQVLDQAPARAFELLMGIGKSTAARAALFARGFTQEQHDYAWSRLQRLGEFVKHGSDLDKDVRAAIAELDAWDDPNFEAIESTLSAGDLDAQAAFLFEGLEPQEGDAAVLGIDTLLKRVAQLEAGTDRKATRKDDTAAIELLASRGYTAEEWERLRGLVTKAKTVTKVEPVSNADREQILTELYKWHREWSSHARNSIKGRATLITLGLARRQSRKKEEAPEGGAADPAKLTDIN